MPARRLTRQVVVRISDDLYEQLTQDAEENGRTVGQTIRFRLEQLYRDGDAG